MSRTRRLVLTTLTSVPLVLGALVALQAPAQAADTDIKINEVESQDGIPGDWVELKNTGATAEDISGYVIKDSGANAFTIPGGTSIAAGGYFTLDVSSMGDADSARFFKPDGTTLLDTLTWATPAEGTWSRCPEGGGPNLDTIGTKNLANACSPVTAWQGSPTPTTVDVAGQLGGNLSGLAYEPSGSATPGSLWSVTNNPGTLRRLTSSAGTWSPAATWTLRYANGTGNPDAEGVTITDAGAAAGVYVAVERNGDGGSQPMVLRYAPSGAGSTISAVNQWDLSANLPGLEQNSGPEAIAWVPDYYLAGKQLLDENLGKVYNPADYPNHGTGLFFVGVEETGQLVGYALNHATNTATRVVTVPRFMSTVTDLFFDQHTQRLWSECDNNCGGRTSLIDIDTSAGPTKGKFILLNQFERPAGAANLNNEGFTIAPNAECVGGQRPVFWADDSNTGGHALSAGTLSCVPSTPPTITAAATSTKTRTAAGWYGAPVTVTFSCTPGGSVLTSAGCPAPVVLGATGANQSGSGSVSNGGGYTVAASVTGINIDLVAPTVKITGVKKGKTYPKKKKPKCVGADALSGLASCTVVQKKKGSKYKVTATATDKAGNVTVVTLTYKVKKPKPKS